MPTKRQSCLKTRHGMVAGLLMLLAILGIYFSAPDIFELVELRLLDWRTLLRGPVDPGPTVKLILLDELSRDRFGMNQGMREGLAVILDDLCRKGVRVVGLDLFFNELGDNGDESKKRLADAMQRCGNVVMGYTWDGVLQAGRLGAAEAVGRRQLLDAARNPDEKGFTPEIIPKSASTPDHEILKQAAAIGYYTVLSDPLNIARKVPAALTFENINHYPFSLAVTRVFLRRSDYKFPVKARFPFLEEYLAGVNLAPDPFGYLWLNEYGKADAFETLSFNDAVARGVPEEFAAQSVVLVGVSGEGSNDLFSTMFDPELPGVVVHATAVANALSHGFLWRDDFVRGIEVALMVFAALVLGLIVPRTHPTFAILLGPSLLVIVWLVSNIVLARYGMWIQLVCPMLLIVLAHVLIITLRMLAAERVCIESDNLDEIIYSKDKPD